MDRLEELGVRGDEGVEIVRGWWVSDVEAVVDFGAGFAFGVVVFVGEGHSLEACVSWRSHPVAKKFAILGAVFLYLVELALSLFSGVISGVLLL